MVQRQPPERDVSGEESIPIAPQPMQKFKALASRLLSVNRAELAAMEQSEKSRPPSRE